MYLRFDFFPFPVLTHVGRIDFIVEVTNITYYRSFLKRLQHVGITYIYVAGSRDDKVCGSHQKRIDTFKLTGIHAIDIGWNDFIAIHTSLHRTDRVDLSYSYNHTFLS